MIEKEEKAKIIDGAKIIIVSPDKILLFHRDNIPTIRYPDCWQLIGGGIEEGETPEEGLIREVKEEVGYDLKEFKLILKKMGRFGQNVWLYVTFVEKSPAVAGQAPSIGSGQDPAVAGQVDEEKELIIDFGFVSGYK